MVTFSVLIPNIGYSPYLFECLDSLVKQKNDGTFSLDIHVCDQSEDHIFKKISKEIENKYKNVNIYHFGIRSSYLARIDLLKKAKGDYIFYIDSDDYLEPNAFDKLTQIIVSTGKLDLYEHFIVGEKRNGLVNCIMNRDDYLNRFLSERGTYPIYKKCFKRRSYDFFNENIFLCDDGLLSLPIILKSKSFYISDLSVYNYRQHSQSGTKKLDATKLEDISTFLVRSLPYRKTEESISELVFNYMYVYISIYLHTKKTISSQGINSKKILDYILSMNIISYPKCFAKQFFYALEGRPFLVKINFYLLKIRKFFNKNLKIVIKEKK